MRVVLGDENSLVVDEATEPRLVSVSCAVESDVPPLVREYVPVTALPARLVLDVWVAEEVVEATEP